ncbi:MAG: DUF6261 family protein [Mediterranea sp.]|nr:DUF6261 family protein [Mediterranea sp.]
MAQTLIRPLRMEGLTIFELLQLSTAINEQVFTSAVVYGVGLKGKPYDDYVAAHTQYAGILKHNPALVETEPLGEDVDRVRILLGVLGDSLRVAEFTGGDAGTEAAKVVSNIAAPYLKMRHKATMLGVLGGARDLCDALQDAVAAPKVELLGLTGQVTVIKELVQQCTKLFDLRGEEKEYRKKLGTARKARAELQKRLRVLFTTILPAIYLTTTDTAVKKNVTTLFDHINATLDTFRHLVGGGTGDGNDDYSDPERPVDPSIPDTGMPDEEELPDNPYIDPNA